MVNPKHKILNTKQYQMTKIQMAEVVLKLEIRICLEFRY